ncbi:hypothetical protein [Bradyrhizobium sp.]|uniref:hypothetical protein n=1 Tax=Bradyrhizobium sp. TaxID=376 RepID=UPI001D7355AE|nr:hypothetical protein [Bradyrhizobium sp.]MBI5319802.1 hypothetical protein [Bradyrhizobium sp.]
MATILKLLGILALLVALAIVAPQHQSNSEPSNESKKDLPQKQRENWNSVNVPPNLDGTIYAYDKNSITIMRGERGQIVGAELMVVIIRGDEAIRGKRARFSFLCDGSGRYRINGSPPLPTQGTLPTQEGYLANVACGAARCEQWRQGGSAVCRD